MLLHQVLPTVLSLHNTPASLAHRPQILCSVGVGHGPLAAYLRPGMFGNVLDFRFSKRAPQKNKAAWSQVTALRQFFSLA